MQHSLLHNGIVNAKNNLQISKLYITLQKKRRDGREVRRLIANQYTQVRLLLPPQKGTAVKIAVPEQTTGGQLSVVQNRG